MQALSAPRRRALATAIWLAALALAGLYVRATLRVSGDLRVFMPTPHTSAERLILEEVSAGPAARVLLVALAGAPPRELAATSTRLAAALRADSSFRLVANGQNLLDTIPRALLPYRYLLSPTLDRHRFDADYLRAELRARERDLASPAASLLEPWLPSDPTLEVLKVLESWRPAAEPQLIDGVWFGPRGHTALMIVESAAPAFDPRAQATVLEHLRAHFAALRASPAVRLTVTGPGAFSVLMERRAQSDAELASILDSLGMIGLMLLAYRSPTRVLLGALPLATGGAVALVLVAALFGTVHGITLAFGFTLIGVAIDYPIFLFSHCRPGVAPLATARAIWPTLAVAVTGLTIAYLAFLLSGVPGLVELACFNVAGLAAAGLATRYALPRLVPPVTSDPGETWLPIHLARLVARLPRPAWLAPALALAALAVVAFVPGALWDNDLGRLTPVPEHLLEQFAQLQHELGAADVRYLMMVEEPSAERALTREEALRRSLNELVARRAIAGFDDAARYLPSIAVQERRRAALPGRAALAAALDEAQRDTAFRPGVFAPFLADVARARQLPPLTPEGLRGTPLELSVGGLLLARGAGATGLITFNDVRDPEALRQLARASGDHVAFVDLKAASEALIAHQRARILASIAGASVLLALTVLAALRSVARAVRVLVPIALATLVSLALLHAARMPLNLFHLIALVLAAGLGLDYALFCERARHDGSASRRTLHALGVCATAACLVFAVLASSTLPVLRSIGVTVVIGVAANFALALMLIRPTELPAWPPSKSSPS